jgi:teichuronic acid biosynthesis glycosyltransferase TuaG
MISSARISKLEMDIDREITPLVSVVIPYYNQARFIAKTISSAKQQTYPNIELVIVDDGSSELASHALDGIDGVTVFHTANAGCPAARNFGFQRCSGEYLVFLDGDDILLPDAIEKNLAALRACPAATLSFGAVRVIDERGLELRPSRVCHPRKNYFLFLLETNPIWSPGQAMIRRDAFRRAGHFRDLRRFQTDDYELYLNLARLGTFVQHDSCVLEYRRHSSSMSVDRRKMLPATLEVLDRLSIEQQLTIFQRWYLRHGKRRWIHTFSGKKNLLARFITLYFVCASTWNISGSRMLDDFFKKCRMKYSWKGSVAIRG